MAKIRTPISNNEPNKAFLEAYITNKPEHEDVLVWLSEGDNVVNIEHPGSVAYGVWGKTVQEAIDDDIPVFNKDCRKKYTVLEEAPCWAITWH